MAEQCHSEGILCWRRFRGGGLSTLAPLRMLDGTVTGTLSFDGEKFIPFFWYGDEVHLPLPL